MFPYGPRESQHGFEHCTWFLALVSKQSNELGVPGPTPDPKLFAPTTPPPPTTKAPAPAAKKAEAKKEAH